MLSEHVVLGPGAGRRRDHGEPARLRGARQPGPGHAVARLDRARERDRRRDQPAPDRTRRRSSRRSATRCCSPSSSRRSTCSRGPPGRAADRELARGRVRGARRAVRARGAILDEQLEAMGARLARHAGRLPRRALRLRRRLPGAEAVPAGGAADVVRRAVGCTPRCCAGSCATATASTRSARRRTTTSQRLRAAMAAAGRDVAELEMVGGIRGRSRGRTTSPTSTRRSWRARRSSRAASRSICFKPSMYTDDPAEVPDALPPRRRPDGRVRGHAPRLELRPHLPQQREHGTVERRAQVRRTAATRPCRAASRSSARPSSRAGSATPARPRRGRPAARTPSPPPGRPVHLDGTSCTAATAPPAARVAPSRLGSGGRRSQVAQERVPQAAARHRRRDPVARGPAAGAARGSARRAGRAPPRTRGTGPTGTRSPRRAARGSSRTRAASSSRGCRSGPRSSSGSSGSASACAARPAVAGLEHRLQPRQLVEELP